MKKIKMNEWCLLALDGHEWLKFFKPSIKWPEYYKDSYNLLSEVRQ